MESTRNSVKVKLGIKVMKLVESLVGWEVTVTGQMSECGKSGRLGSHCNWSKVRMSFNIREWETAYC